MNPYLTSTTETPTTFDQEPVTLGRVKQALDEFRNDYDTEIYELIKAARDQVERWSYRTVRLSVTRQLQLCKWQSLITIPKPPLISVLQIQYYDTDNNVQTLPTSVYQTTQSDDGPSRIWFTDEITNYRFYDRPDAVLVDHTTGYQTRDAIPHSLENAVILNVRALYDVGAKSATVYAERARQLALHHDWGVYT